MEEKKMIIEVKDLEKAYKLYDKPSDRLKEALGLGRKKAIQGALCVKRRGFKCVSGGNCGHNRY